MILLKGLNFIKRNSIVCIALFLLCSLKSYTQDTTVAYLVKPGLKTMTREQFLKADTLCLTCNNCKVYSFTIVVTGPAKPPLFCYRQVVNNKILEDIRNAVMSSDSATVTIDEIRIIENGKMKDLPPFSFIVNKPAN